MNGAYFIVNVIYRKKVVYSKEIVDLPVLSSKIVEIVSVGGQANIEVVYKLVGGNDTLISFIRGVCLDHAKMALAARR